MPWLYEIVISDPDIDAGQVQDDWVASYPGDSGDAIAEDMGAVTRVDDYALAVSVQRNAQYSDMETHDYVHSVTERKEIPETLESRIEFGHGVSIA